ncbi:BRE1-domain-containing protein [Panus rudis PR-1116 ss-1]|nr:BRE1-domain-containing protein [Panus rudis PR-1116 ss-1]
MMESRKRSRTEEGDSVRGGTKKRVLSSPSHEQLNGPPVASTTTSVDADEPKDGDSLELFRKDAIYRRMKHYSRENDRNLGKIAELELRNRTCEAGLAALEACWTQLVGTIRSVVSPNDLPGVDVDTQEIFDLSKHASDTDTIYTDALRAKMAATQQLVTAFVQLSGKGKDTLRDETSKRYQEAQTENASLRSEVNLIRSRLNDAQSEKERLREQLVAAEKRIDRLQSKSLASLYPPQGSASPHPSSEREHSVGVKDESSPRDSPSSPAPVDTLPNGNGDYGKSEGDDWKVLADHRQSVIEKLDKENLSLKQENAILKIKIVNIPEEFAVQTKWYKILVEQASRIQQRSDSVTKERDQLREEIDQLQQSTREAQEETQTLHEKVVQDLKSIISKRDTELIRLREQRDQINSELHERKAKEQVKLASLHEFKTLAESRSERIKVLESEVLRLKTRLAAEAGDEDLLTFLFKGASEDLSYVNDLKQRLSASEDRAKSLESSLAFFQEDHPDVAQHMRNEAEAKQQLAEISRRLEKYKSTFGENLSSLPSDVQSLTEQLKQKESEVEKLRLLEKQREQTESSLYSELDRLSAAWEALDKQVKSRAVDLAAWEERVTKAGIDKAKVENKYYAAVRDKDALENERKNLSRNLEKQTKLIEKLVATEKTLQAQVATLEKECAVHRREEESLQRNITFLEQEKKELRINFEADKKDFQSLRQIVHSNEQSTHAKKAELLKAEEELVRARKAVEKEAAKLKASQKAHSGSSTAREAQLQSEIDKCMTLLQCSTCKMNMRNTVITKCMHSFCKSCIDSRISSRQRKCPACNIAFSQGEVQHLYFQ